MAAPPPFEELPAGSLHTPHEPQIQESLPDYSPRAHVSQPVPEREFEYKVEKKKGETFASLKVLSLAAYSKSLPTFCGAGPVKGSMNLYLKEPETITFVAISVKGRFLPNHQDYVEQLLFDISHTVWSKDTNDTAKNVSHSNKKLSGTHSWPFSFNIPERISSVVESSRTSGADQHYIPQTFNERGIHVSIQYDITMRVGRGKFKTNYIISCKFGYFPVTRPPPFPVLKTIAYQEGTPLLDPTIDINGWVHAKKVKISGTLFNSHPAEIHCQLYLSAPLTYTRGSVIPLYVCIQSSDRQALDLLATHKALTIRLERRIQWRLPMASIKNTEKYPIGLHQGYFPGAVWWPVPSQEQGSPTSIASGTAMHTAYLNGEIHLRGDLTPSTTLPLFTVQYYVGLSTFNIPGFKMAGIDKNLLEHPVDIVTSFAPGPRAVRHAPPGYNSEHPFVTEFVSAPPSSTEWMA